MQFNSYIFILVFLPLAVILYFSARMLKPVYGKLVLITAGLIFYGCGGYEMLALLLVSMIINYLSALVIHRRGPGHRVLTVLPVIVNVGSLLYFKYYNFLIINLNAFTGKDLSVRDILLPLGISFYTFQQIAYLAAVSRGELERTDLLDYMVFILFFPKLLMGPRTMESSTKSSFFPSISSGTGICFIFATWSRTSWLAGMKERGQVGVYLTKGLAKGFPLRFAYPIACGMPESGTPAT